MSWATQGKGWFGGGADLTPYYLHDEDVRVRAYVYVHMPILIPSSHDP